MKRLHYGWFMVIISTCVLTMLAPTMFTFGIFLRPLAMEFGWERGALSGAFSVLLLLAGPLGILTGRLSDKYGPRLLVTLGGLLLGIGFCLMSQINSLWQVYLIWGFFMGIGASCGYIPVVSTIPRWFVKRRGIAIAITAAGFGLGATISPLLVQWLISSYGWQQSFLVMGVITFIIVIPLAQFMKQSPQRIGLKPYGEEITIEDKQSLALVMEGLSFKQAINTKQFWIFGFLLLGYLICYQVIIVHIAPYAVDIDISAIVAASILSIIAGSSILGKLSMGIVADKIGGRLALSACLTLITLTLIWLLFSREVWMFYLFAVVFGLAYGGIITLETLISAELFGLKSLGVIVGGLLFFETIGGALGGPLAGRVFDVTRSYNLALLICVIVSTLAMILSLMLLKGRKKAAVSNWVRYPE